MKLPIRLMLALSLLIAGAKRSEANVEQRKMMAEFAQQIQKFLKGQRTNEIVIGEFTGPPSNKTSAGPNFVEMLAQELAKLDIVVKEQGKLGIEGRYSLTEVPATDPADARIGKKVLALKIKCELVDAFDNRKKFNFERKVLLEGTKVIKGEATLVKTFGVTTPLSPNDTELQTDNKLRQTIIEKEPSVHLDGSKVRSKEGQPFAIEILVRGKAVPPSNKGGLAFLRLKRGDIYAVRIINEADHEVAVQLSIDGLSIYTFSELRQPDKLSDGKPNPKVGEPRYTAMIVPPKKGNKPGVATIRGWHRNNKPKGEDSFQITAYAKSALARVGKPTGQSTITATFQAAWEKGKLPPKDEPGKRRGGQGDRTGFGPRAGAGFREVKRDIGVLRDVISIRYNVPSE